MTGFYFTEMGEQHQYANDEEYNGDHLCLLFKNIYAYNAIQHNTGVDRQIGP